MNDGIFFRLLSQLSATQLQRHCNTVFRNELRLVRVELKELLAALERLKEVRKAVALAENGRAGVGRTPSLLATMTDALRTRDSVIQLVGMLGDRMGLPYPGSSSAAAVEPEPPLQELTRKRTRNAPEHDVDQEGDKTEEQAVRVKKARRGQPPEATQRQSGNESPVPTSNRATNCPPERRTVASPADPVADVDSTHQPARTPPPCDQFTIQVTDALHVGEKLKNPTKSQLKAFVESVVQLVATVKVAPGERTLANSNFKRLVATTVLVLIDVQDRRCAAPLVRSMANAVTTALARDPALAELASYCDKLVEMSTFRCSAASEFEMLVAIADDLPSIATAERSDQLVDFVSKVTSHLRASFPTKRVRNRPQADEATITAAVNMAVALVINEPPSIPHVEAYTQFLNRLNAVNSCYAAMQNRVGN